MHNSTEKSRLLRTGSFLVPLITISLFGLGIYFIFSGGSFLQVLIGTIFFAISIFMTSIARAVFRASRASKVRESLTVRILNPFSTDYELRVSWPKNSTPLRARFGLWSSKETIEGLAQLIPALSPPSFHTYFMVYEERSGKGESHFALKQFLKESGELFHEKQSRHGPGTLFGSSSNKDTFQFILRNYEFDYSIFGGTYIAIALGDVADWERRLEDLPSVPEEFIEDCHIIIAPHLDHGYEIVSNKISEKEFILQLADLAKRRSQEFHLSYA